MSKILIYYISKGSRGLPRCSYSCGDRYDPSLLPLLLLTFTFPSSLLLSYFLWLIVFLANFALTKLASFVSSVTSSTHDKFAGYYISSALLSPHSQSSIHPSSPTLTILSSLLLNYSLTVHRETLPKAILFTNKDKTSDLYKALSVDFHHRFVLGEAKHTDKKLGMSPPLLSCSPPLIIFVF